MDDSERSYGYSRDIYHGRRGPGGHYGSPIRSYDEGLYYPVQPHHERSYEYAGPGDGAESPNRGFPRGGGYGPESRMVHTFDGPPYPVGPAEQIGPFAGVGPEGYRRADERIEEDVCERLTAHGAVDASQVQVRVEEGEVTLEGTVTTRRMKKLAEALSDTVPGVVDVHNRLRLEPAEPPSI